MSSGHLPLQGNFRWRRRLNHVSVLDPNTAAAATDPVQAVEIGESVFADGVTDLAKIDRRQLRNLNSGVNRRLENARQKAAATRRAHEEAPARSRVEQDLYSQALARHRAEWRHGNAPSMQAQRRRKGGGVGSAADQAMIRTGTDFAAGVFDSLSWCHSGISGFISG